MSSIKLSVRISPLILLFLGACSPVATATPLEVQNTTTEVLVTPAVEVAQPPKITPEEEQIYPYYLSLATKPEVVPQTIDGVIAEIDWVYVDESRVALQYTVSGLDWPDGSMSDSMSVRIASASLSDADYNGGGNWSDSPAKQGVISGNSDQFFREGALNAEEHPSIDLRVDIPVKGPSTVGTFHFEFNIPVLDGIKMENIDQTVLANHISMTLKTLVLNPSRAEAIVCFQMPSEIDWGLTASTITIGSREYRFSGGGVLPGTKGKESVDDSERCRIVEFDILYDEATTSVTLTVPKLMASIPEVITPERVAAANQRLADIGIEFDYVNKDHGGNIVILKRPESVSDEEIYPLIWDALAEQYEGPWVFTVPIER
ncbi:MAG TPA: hypothetical protein VK880_01760 [Anaerolineales bacterium]|nr:hypothetical protein [Anaerolineales bacterium]